VRFASAIGISQKTAAGLGRAAVLNLTYVELILYLATASYAEANYNVDNYYVFNLDRVHSSNLIFCGNTNFLERFCQ
jgi:hypothetical protein